MKEFSGSMLENILNAMGSYIYITDIETHEIVFVTNNLDEIFSKGETLVGQTCWRVIQAGQEDVCDFCPLPWLVENPGKPYFWQHLNEITHRRYQNTSTLMKWLDGRTVHVQSAIDVTDMLEAERVGKKRLQQQQLMSAISQSFIYDSNNDMKIRLALERTANFIKADLAFASKYEEAENTLRCTHEWHDKGLDSPAPLLAKCEFLRDSACYSHMRNNRHFSIADLSSAESNAFSPFAGSGLRSIILAPIIASNKLWGTVGFASRTARHWDSTDIQMCKHMGGVLSIVTRQFEMRREILLMSALVNSATSYISFIDESYRFRFLNRAIEEISGFSMDELMREGPELLYDKETNDNLRNEIIPNTRLYGSGSGELTITRKDGEKRILSFNSFLIDPNNPGTAAVATDITERKLMEAELLLAKESADKANRAKSEFLSRMSHEMRTPLNSILGMTSIAMSTDDRERHDYCLKRIEDASNQLMGVINDILDMSKIEAAKLELTILEFDLELMIDHIMSVAGFEAEKKSQKIRIYVNSDIPRHVIGDEMHLSQVITNLLGNAIKFSPEGGNIIINMFLDDDNACDDSIALCFEIIDDGIGISKEQQQRLFDSVESLDHPASHKLSGSGLGLTISKKLVEMMDGSIEVESSPGAGSTFRFRVRLHVDKERRDRSGDASRFLSRGDSTPASDKVRALGRKKILLAEDIEVNREIIALFMEDTELEIDFAKNGEEAARLFEESGGRYDLIFMDIHMPVADGYEATRRIRASGIEGAESVPIVAMTANAFKEDIDRCIESGMNDHLAKPVTREEIYEKIALSIKS